MGALPPVSPQCHPPRAVPVILEKHESDQLTPSLKSFHAPTLGHQDLQKTIQFLRAARLSSVGLASLSQPPGKFYSTDTEFLLEAHTTLQSIHTPTTPRELSLSLPVLLENISSPSERPSTRPSTGPMKYVIPHPHYEAQYS